MFSPLPPRIDLPEIERGVLRRWKEDRVFERSLERTRGGPVWVFYEGPPTANGLPGTHHIEARVFKDVFPRFKSMKGHHVPRTAGWDCHGLPVEVAVEKELGLSSKHEIEKYGVAEFNARCRESVLRHVDAFEELTDRMGYWTDLSGAYRTMDTAYIESVWWSLKVIFEKGLLVRDFRISPYCARCGTPLSDHEMGQPDVYRTVTDVSVTVRLPVTSGPLAGGADLLVWTTTPWTLVSNTAVAVHPDIVYTVARVPGEERAVVVARDRLADVLGADARVERELTGHELAGSGYLPPFDLVPVERGHTVLAADFVTTLDGTGLVHLAPAFGADDFTAVRAAGMPVVNPVRPDGRFDDGLPLVGGSFVKDAEPPIVEDLRRRGLLYRAEDHEHDYPHCWRCDTALLYYALPAWFVRTTAVREELLAQNEVTNWYPSGVKDGRYGEWLRNNVDWALSRNRYWGTPLPIWECADGHVVCAGSLAELSELSGTDLSRLDPHRPHIDEVVFPCPRCGAPATRVPEVIDAWYDSGAMPFAQWGAPHIDEERFRATYPAQFICEGIDQTRGWFYSLMAVGTLVFGRSPYENVLCLGLILAEDGRKMSKHLGNVMEPMPLMDRHGADALRWFMAAAGSPWSARRINHEQLDEIVRKVLLTYWNTVSFFALYAAAGGWTPDREAPPPAERPLLDRWVRSELYQVAAEVEGALEDFDPVRACRALSRFIDDLSNWYVRRSRRRFWQGAATSDGASAFATLYESLEVLTRLLAPVVPFLSDHVWSLLRVPEAPDSVHLATWPTVPEGAVDEELSTWMRLVRRIVELGRAARVSNGVRVRQPLSRALVNAPGFASLPLSLREQIAEELNVQEVLALSETEDGGPIDIQVKPVFRALGRRYGRRTQDVARAVRSADPGWLAARIRAEGSAILHVAGVGEVEIGRDDVVVTELPRSGWSVRSADGETIALDLRLTPGLLRSGMAREAVRLIQQARKASGLNVSDRIALWWQTADEELAAALEQHTAVIAAEVLAAEVTRGRPGAALPRHTDGELGLTFWFTCV